MNIVPLFSTPIAKFSNFITSEERVKLYQRIKKTKHHRFGAIAGDGFSTYSETKKSPEVIDISTVMDLEDDRKLTKIHETPFPKTIYYCINTFIKLL